MHLATHRFKTLVGLATLSALAFVLAVADAADRTPLLGSTPPAAGLRSSSTATGLVRLVAPDSVACLQTATFDEVITDISLGVDIDGLFASGGVFFGERFVGQTLGYEGVFDHITGLPSDPLTLEAGLPGQNLNVFDYSTNVLSGLGYLGFPDLDAIGEGSIAMRFGSGQSQVRMDLVGGNGGTAQLDFYAADGSLVDTVVLSGLADQTYGFATVDGSPTIVGIEIQSTDAAGVGIDNVCHDTGFVPTRSTTWGRLKSVYR